MVGFSYITTLVNYGILRNATIALKKKAHHDEIVDVIRAEAKTHISSVDLVPGDHILITTNMLVPCDCVLIDGETSVDEQSLTGESIPVHKISLR
jgi:P-type E1-E2 ATPase